MRNAKSGSKWKIVAIAAIFAVLAWNAYRSPTDAPVAVHPPTSSPTPAADTTAHDARTPTTPLELPPPIATSTGWPDFLPSEAIDTLSLIARGGPYSYRQDDGVFGNRESRLPRQARGYYREYTVKTPGSRDRGARRIITGGHPPVEYFYTDDHYRSFRRFTSNHAEAVQ